MPTWPSPDCHADWGAGQAGGTKMTPSLSLEAQPLPTCLRAWWYFPQETIPHGLPFLKHPGEWPPLGITLQNGLWEFPLWALVPSPGI